jgi:hypothetical protein
MSVDQVENNMNNIIEKTVENTETVENQNTETVENQNTETVENQNLNQFDFMSFLSNITNPEKDNDSKTDVLNQMLGNIFQSFLKNKVGDVSDSDSESESESESESDSESSSDYSDLDAIFLIKEMDKEVVFTTTYSNAKSSLLSKIHLHLYVLTSRMIKL